MITNIVDLSPILFPSIHLLTQIPEPRYTNFDITKRDEKNNKFIQNLISADFSCNVIFIEGWSGKNLSNSGEEHFSNKFSFSHKYFDSIFLFIPLILPSIP